jgi:fatty-acyl-CoA synthase
MQGLMQDWPLTVDRILDHAALAHAHGEVVTRSIEGSIVRTTYAQIHERAKRATGAMLALGVRPGDRVGTLAWNTARHIEAWYGIMGMGAICHTLNPRLLPAQLGWMANHAGDKVIIADACFAPLLTPILMGAPGVEHIVWLTDEANRPDFAAPHDHGLKGIHCMETLLDQSDANHPWGGFDEGTAAGLCYTSGTTGDPKGVLYSHRSNVLHSMMCMQTDVMGISGRETILGVVPMFHANAWGLPFTAPAIGARLVMPGARLGAARADRNRTGELFGRRADRVGRAAGLLATKR